MIPTRHHRATRSKQTRNRDCIGRLAARSTTTRAPNSGSPARSSHGPMVSSAPTDGLDLANDGDDLAEDGRVVAGDRVERRIVRHQPHLTTGALESLDCRFAVDHRLDDVTVVDDGVMEHYHPVAVA